MISVALTVRNARRSIEAQLQALAAQKYDAPWEIVVSDGNSSDGTKEFVEEWIKGAAVPARLVSVGRLGIAAGRNTAVEETLGESILFCDADDLVAPDWVRSMSACLEEASLVIGRVHLVADNSDGTIRDLSLKGWEGSIVGPDKSSGFLASGLTANLGFRRELFDSLQGFDEQLDVGEDIDFVWRAQEEGIVPGYCSDSAVRKTVRSTAFGRFRQHFRFGRADPKLYRKHRAFGMRPSLSEATKAWVWLLANAPRAVLGRGRLDWVRVFGHRLGRLVGSVQQRAFYP